MYKKRIFFMSFLIFSIFSYSNELSCNKNIGWGPINHHISSPLRGIKNEMKNIMPLTLDKNSYIAKSSYSWVNIWNYKKNYFTIDMEVLSMEYMFSIGLSNDYILHLNMPFYHIGGGILDSTIESFHNSIGISNANREVRDRNSVEFNLTDYDGNTYSLSQDELHGLNSGNLNVIFQKNIFSDPNCARAFFLDIQFPTSKLKDTLDEQKINTTISYAWAKKRKRHYHYYKIGLSRFGNDIYNNIKLNSLVPTIFYAVETKVRDNMHRIIQLQWDSGIAKNIPEYDSSTYILNYGWKWKINRNIISFSLIENIFNFDNSPDFGFYFSRSFYGKRATKCLIENKKPSSENNDEGLI